MPRYALTIAYDGTDFCGWQRQEPRAEAHGGAPIPPRHILAPASDPALGGVAPDRVELRTVQAVVQRAVREVVREPVELLGSSRTDSGVHARGQVAAFTTSKWPVERGLDALLRALNGRLPDDVLVVAAAEVGEDFDPIAHAVAKGYSYTLHCGRVPPLFDRRYVQHVWEDLDVTAMQRAAACLLGEHDFAAFAAAGHGRTTTVRRVLRCEVVNAGEAPDAGPALPSMPRDVERMPGARRIRIEVASGGFLYNMVRIIAGTLVEVGKGRLSAADVRAALESRDRRGAGPTLPPAGLCLEWIRHDPRRGGRTVNA